MSSYTVFSRIPGYVAHVGWDALGQTYFASIKELDENEDEPDIQFLVGSWMDDSCDRADELVRKTMAYMVIPDHVLEAVIRDRMQDPAPVGIIFITDTPSYH